MYRYRVTLPILMFILGLSACDEPPAQGQAASSTVTTPPATADSTVLPGTVAAALAELTGMCSDAGGTPRTDAAVRHIDLNGDGHDDFILYAGWISCENAWSIYGDREKIVDVFTGDGANGATLAFAASVFDARTGSADGRQILWLTTSGEACGRPPAATFAEESFCERAIVAQGPGKFEFAPVNTVRMIQ
jgi:hypothetical protein